MKLIKSNDIKNDSHRLHIIYRNDASFLVRSPKRGGYDFTSLAPKFVGATIVKSDVANLLAVPMEQIESFVRYFSGTNETIYVDIAISNYLERLSQGRMDEMHEFLLHEYGMNLMNGTLMNFQKKGVAFLRLKKNAIEADDMGLGKTIQAIEYVLRERSEGTLVSVLIVVPASLKQQWKREIERFSPVDDPLTVQIIDGSPTAREAQWQVHVNVVIVNYETLCNDIEYGFLKRGMFSHIIVDEASYIKNPNTKRSKAVRAVGKTCDSRIAMTGTPLENHVEELWSIGNFVDPASFGTRSAFRKRYSLLLKKKIKPEQERQRTVQLNDLRNTLKNVMIRRRKTDVLTELPPVTVTRHDVQLHPAVQAMHDTLAASLRELVEEYQRLSSQARNQHMNEILFSLSHQILAKLTYMRELCLMPELIIQDQTYPNVKLIRLLEILDDMNSDDKVVIFTEFRRVAEMLHTNIPNSAIVHGGVNQTNRAAIIENFKTDPNTRVLISTSVLQFGVNLQFANYIVNYDLHYNPAKMAQRIDRLHRIGQNRNVTVINLIANNTIEEIIEAILIRKYNLFCAVIEGRFVAANFTDRGAIEEISTAVVGRVRRGERTRRMANLRQRPSQHNGLSQRFEGIIQGFDPRFIHVLRIEAEHIGESAWFHELEEAAREWNIQPTALLHEEEAEYLEGLQR